MEIYIKVKKKIHYPPSFNKDQLMASVFFHQYTLLLSPTASHLPQTHTHCLSLLLISLTWMILKVKFHGNLTVDISLYLFWYKDSYI